jgi:hypothetical protein
MVNGMNSKKIDDSIKNLFVKYEKAFQSLDFKKQADFFADAFIMAGPGGAVSESKSEFLKNAGRAVDFYKSIGQNSAKIISLSETPISDHYSLVKTHWGVTFQKFGEKVIEFDVSYIVLKSGKKLEIILAIAHQDEQEAMRKLGLIKER